MAENCPKLDECPIFEKFSGDAAKQIWTRHYCKGNYEACARYQLSQKGKKAPITLLPDGSTDESLTAD